MQTSLLMVSLNDGHSSLQTNILLISIFRDVINLTSCLVLKLLAAGMGKQWLQKRLCFKKLNWRSTKAFCSNNFAVSQYLGSLCCVISHIWALAGGEVHLTSFSSVPLHCICFHCLHRCNCKNFTWMGAVRAWENPPGKPAWFFLIYFVQNYLLNL